MEIEVDEDRAILLKKVYLPIRLATGSGEQMDLMMRDSGFELIYEGKRYEAKEGMLRELRITPSSSLRVMCDAQSPGGFKVTTNTPYSGSMVRQADSDEQFVEPSFTYPKHKDVKTKAEFNIVGDDIKIDFSCNGGKHGTDEALAGFKVTPDQLMEALEMYSERREDIEA